MLSPGKILVILAVVGILWIVYKFGQNKGRVEQNDQPKAAPKPEANEKVSAKVKKDEPFVQEMKACPKCGDYVPANYTGDDCQQTECAMKKF